jgi:predicted glycoside hydrolase/deacetylase ChbG (UPF0249 family)
VPAARRLLIVNADDFGLSAGVNAGIVEAHRRGLVTSASLLANAPRFPEAAAAAADNPRLGVGAHLNLVRGKPLSPAGEIPELVDAAGLLRPFRLRRPSRPFLAQAEAEYRRQLEAILAAGLRPTHIDFEKHHAWQGPLHRLACRLAAEHGIPAVRNLREEPVWAWRRLGWPGWGNCLMALGLRIGTALSGPPPALARPDRLIGQCHIGRLDEKTWLRLAANVPPGISEVMTHPGLAGDERQPGEGGMGGSWLGRSRQIELAALLSPLVRRALAAAGVELINFGHLAGAAGGGNRP